MKEKRSSNISNKLILPLGLAMLAVVMAAVFIFVSVRFTALRLGDWHSILGSALLLLSAFVVFALYLVLFKRGVITDIKRMLLVCICILASSLASLLTMYVDICFSPMLLAVLLIALLVDKGTAAAAALLCSVITGVIAACSGIESAIGAPITSVICFNAFCGVIAVYCLGLRTTRSTPVIAAAVAGACGIIVFTAVMMLYNEMFIEYWRHLIWIIGAALLCGILTVGLMPLFETVFDIATDARLNEYLNNNNPLLKRLMLEAPGTYHHSMIVASLAEAAAEEVGANALLCKVSAYYHDVGKLRSPQCFKENQKPGYNIHDELDPYESAQRIIAHQHDGVVLLTKHRLPSAVSKIVSEHHGDSVMVYFYDKALKAAQEGEKVDESKFRYPSQKPSSKESAIIMLADCCEAAVRSMPNPTIEEISAKVREVITHKWDKRDSMLWASPLTFKEICTIEDCFIRTFAALHHERVEYPDLDEVDVR